VRQREKKKTIEERRGAEEREGEKVGRINVRYFDSHLGELETRSNPWGGEVRGGSGLVERKKTK